MVRRIESPTDGPTCSLTCLNRSMSSVMTVGRRFPDARPHGEGGVEPVEEQLAVGQAGQVVVHGIVEQALLGGLGLGAVRQRADDPHHLAVRTHHGAGLQGVPEVMAVGGAQAEEVRDATAALLQHGVERGAVALPVEAVQQVEPARGRAFEAAALEAQLVLDLRADVDAVGVDVPVEDDVARARQRQGLALRVGDRAVAEAGPREGVLHDGEADEHHEQHEPAHQGRGHEVVREDALDGETRRRHPHGQDEPGGDQHHGAIVAVGGQVQHQDQPDARHGGQRDAGDARRHGRVVEGEADERQQEHEPRRADVPVAHVPAVEVEVGEQEHEEGGGQHRLGHGARQLVGVAAHREEPVPEAEVDAHVGQHRPGQRGGGGEDDGAPHHEDDAEEQRQQPRDADHDALVEGQVGDLVLVGVRRPKGQLRQVRRAQLRHVGDGRAGVERDAEDVGVGAVLRLGREALARRDGRDAVGAEVGPHQPGADEAEVRRHEQALDLLVGVVGQREDDPVRPRAALLRADLDAPHDAVGAGRGGDLDAVALAGEMLDHGRQVDGGAVQRYPDRFHGERGPQGREAEQGEDDQGEGTTHGTWTVWTRAGRFGGRSVTVRRIAQETATKR